MVLELNGYSAWIVSDNKELEEYAIQVEGKVISCYICSEEGMKFVLGFGDDGSHLSKHRAHYGRTIDIKMDGTKVNTVWGDFKEELKSDGVQVGNALRPYVFAAVGTTDDDNVAVDANSEHIGTIQVEIRRGRNLGRKKGGEKSSTSGSKAPGLSNAPVHERSKKAGSHRVVLGEGTDSHQGTTDINVTDVDRTPWVIFRFLYRKRDVLKANKILPQSRFPSPIPDNSPVPSTWVGGLKDKGKGIKREIDNDCNDGVVEVSDDGLEALEDELIQRLRDKIARKKAKRAKKFIKREPSSFADVIDLT